MQVAPASVTIVKRIPTTVTICGIEYKAEKRILRVDAKYTRPVTISFGAQVKWLTQSEPFLSSTFAETTEIIDPKYWEGYIQRLSK